jgi:hypothetical protein
MFGWSCLIRQRPYIDRRFSAQLLSHVKSFKSKKMNQDHMHYRLHPYSTFLNFIFRSDFFKNHLSLISNINAKLWKRMDVHLIDWKRLIIWPRSEIIWMRSVCIKECRYEFKIFLSCFSHYSYPDIVCS